MDTSNQNGSDVTDGRHASGLSTVSDHMVEKRIMTAAKRAAYALSRFEHDKDDPQLAAFHWSMARMWLCRMEAAVTDKRVITAKDGLLLWDNAVLNVAYADRLADLFGYGCAEQLVKALGGQRDLGAR